MFKNCSGISLIAFVGFCSVKALADIAPPPPPAPKDVGSNARDSAAIVVEEKGFSMTPPPGWIQRKDFPDATLVLEAPEDAQAKYRATIQVTSFFGPTDPTDSEVEKFEAEYAKRFREADSSIRDFSFRNRQPVHLDSGLDAVLLYSDFRVGETNLMHMHVLVSSSDYTFLATYTDLAENIETNEGGSLSPSVQAVWQSLNSIKLTQPAQPSDYSSLFTIVMAMAGAAGLVVFLRARSQRKQLAEIERISAEVVPLNEKTKRSAISKIDDHDDDQDDDHWQLKKTG